MRAWGHVSVFSVTVYALLQHVCPLRLALGFGDCSADAGLVSEPALHGRAESCDSRPRSRVLVSTCTWATAGPVPAPNGNGARRSGHEQRALTKARGQGLASPGCAPCRLHAVVGSRRQSPHSVCVDVEAVVFTPSPNSVRRACEPRDSSQYLRGPQKLCSAKCQLPFPGSVERIKKTYRSWGSSCSENREMQLLRSVSGSWRAGACSVAGPRARLASCSGACVGPTPWPLLDRCRREQKRH